MALEHALLQAVGHRHVRHAAVEGAHALMAVEPVAALHVIGRPGKEQLAEAKTGDEHPGFAHLTGAQIHPLDRIAGVVDLDALARCEVPGRHRRLPQLRVLAVELLPEVRVAGEALGALLPDELQRMSEPDLMQNLRPVDLGSPQRARCRATWRRAQPVAQASSLEALRLPDRDRWPTAGRCTTIQATILNSWREVDEDEDANQDEPIQEFCCGRGTGITARRKGCTQDGAHV